MTANRLCCGQWPNYMDKQIACFTPNLQYSDSIITKLNYLITSLFLQCSLAYRCITKFGSNFSNAQILCYTLKNYDSIFNQSDSIMHLILNKP